MRSASYLKVYAAISTDHTALVEKKSSIIIYPCKYNILHMKYNIPLRYNILHMKYNIPLKYNTP